jgi:hypothetical protein
MSIGGRRGRKEGRAKEMKGRRREEREEGEGLYFFGRQARKPK